ncbi:unnamed protein product [Acanthosepion pharaonis]|uniref:Uncharacterized protein n=1 Tax=Acanthosepion pharaonis TaxID=158019 RepID=A0A812CB30_ACAPH|nr:unnamed protein product [Sepia pharaonis]
MSPFQFFLLFHYFRFSYQLASLPSFHLSKLTFVFFHFNFSCPFFSISLFPFSFLSFTSYLHVISHLLSHSSFLLFFRLFFISIFFIYYFNFHVISGFFLHFLSSYFSIFSFPIFHIIYHVCASFSLIHHLSCLFPHFLFPFTISHFLAIILFYPIYSHRYFFSLSFCIVFIFVINPSYSSKFNLKPFSISSKFNFYSSSYKSSF